MLYAKVDPNSVEAKEHGKYLRLNRCDRHGGLAPDKIDVVGVVNGKDVEVRIAGEQRDGVSIGGPTSGLTAAADEERGL